MPCKDPPSVPSARVSTVPRVVHSDSLARASDIVDRVAADLRGAEAIAERLTNLTGVTESALMVTCAAHVAFELVHSALMILRAELDARLSA